MHQETKKIITNGLGEQKNLTLKIQKYEPATGTGSENEEQINIT